MVSHPSHSVYRIHINAQESFSHCLNMSTVRNIAVCAFLVLACASISSARPAQTEELGTAAILINVEDNDDSVRVKREPKLLGHLLGLGGHGNGGNGGYGHGGNGGYGHGGSSSASAASASASSGGGHGSSIASANSQSSTFSAGPFSASFSSSNSQASSQNSGHDDYGYGGFFDY